MSWHTLLQIAQTGDVTVEFDTLEATFRTLLQRDGIHHHMLEDLHDAWVQGEGSCNVHAAYLQQLFREIAPLITPGSLEIRCLGEEFRHTWIMSISAGTIDFSEGLWHYD